jgi:hypothetical protein
VKINRGNGGIFDILFPVKSGGMWKPEIRLPGLPLHWILEAKHGRFLVENHVILFWLRAFGFLLFKENNILENSGLKRK